MNIKYDWVKELECLKRMNKFFSKKQCLFLLFVICFNFGIYYSARYISNPFYHYSFETIIDLKIPCIPWMIIFYWGCYIFWIINYLLCIKYEKGKPNQFIVSHFIGESICFLCFLFIPTTMHRPDVQGNGFFETILKLTYLYDQPDNLFPSIHCFASWLCWIGVRRNKDIPRCSCQ